MLFVLEALVQSADAFPPLKSAASGLLFFARYADVSARIKPIAYDVLAQRPI